MEKKKAAHDGGPDQFPRQVEADKLTISGHTATFAESSSNIHPFFQQVLEKLEPLRQAVTAAPTVEERRRASLTLDRVAQQRVSGLDVYNGDLHPIYVSRLLLECRFNELAEISEAVEEALSAQSRQHYNSLLSSSGLPVSEDLKNPWITNTPERAELFKAATLWLERLDVGQTELRHTITGDAYWHHVSPANSKGLFLCGMTGSGKTKLASIIANAIMAAGTPVRWFSEYELATEFREIFAYRSSYTEREFIAELVAVPVLVIDDLGLGNFTQGFLPKLYEIIDKRTTRDRTLIISSNLNLTDLARATDARIASRLHLLESLGTFPKVDVRKLPDGGLS